MPVDDFSDRVNKLLSNSSKSQTDDELAKRFQNVFSTQPIASQKNPTSYHIPDNAYNDDIDKEIENMLQDSDDDEIDDYIYGVLGSSSGGKIQEKMDGFQKIFLGSENGGGDGADDESMELIRKLQAENALDEKYSQFTKSRDEDMEQRYNALRKDPPTFHSTYENGERPKGLVPKPLETDDLHDEMDDWCCICNDDATIECEGCEDDNKYCKECFFHTHRSESADYEATKHKSKRYQK